MRGADGENDPQYALQAETGHYVGRLEELAFNQGG